MSSANPRKVHLRYTVRPAKILRWLLIVMLLSISGLTYGQTPRWKLFSNRAGWSIDYPDNWKLGSCKSCLNVTAPDVFVDFFPPTDEDDGFVMVESLRDKPSGATVDAWFTDIKQAANQNPQLAEQRFTLNGLPALRVRYRNPSDGGS